MFHGVNMDDKKKLIFDVIFDIYKILLTAGLTIFGMVVVKVAFSEGSFNTGVALCIIDIIGLLYISLVFGAMLHHIYNN
jgi:hypothetical protein